MLRTALASETNVLARALNRISEQNRRTRDFTLSALRNALREVITAFPVYRTYVACGESEVGSRKSEEESAAAPESSVPLGTASDSGGATTPDAPPTFDFRFRPRPPRHRAGGGAGQAPQPRLRPVGLRFS